jgi:hypothetical protein
MTVELPDGYEALYMLIGYDSNGRLSCCESNSEWESYHPECDDFIEEPQHYIFLKKIKKPHIIKPPVYKFFIEDTGNIVPLTEMLTDVLK